MRITSRRLEFLKTVQDLYDRSKLPVHYARVGELMGISKWSAYEMLKSLEKDGLVASHYEVNPGEKHPGRAMILFSPTEMLAQILPERTPEGKAVSLDWRQLSDSLLGIVAETDKKLLKPRLDQLLKDLPSIDSPLVFCAYVITLLASQLKSLGEGICGLVRGVLRETVRAETTLAMFVGISTGLMIKSVAFGALNPLWSIYLNNFEKNLSKLDQSEQQQLLGFLNQALKGS